MKDLHSIIICPNGTASYWDKTGKQAEVELQNWLPVYLEYLESEGVILEAEENNPDELNSIELLLNGEMRKVKPFKYDGGWNWEILES